METLRLRSSIRDIRSINLYKSLVAECIGTFILVYIGAHSGPFKINSLKVGMGYGFGGAVAIYCIGNVSGGHINPAVSFSLLIARQISLLRFIFYCVFQVFGAIVAAKLSRYSELPKNTTESAKSQQRHENNGQLFVCEILITFTLVFTVMRLCVEKCRSDSERALAPFIIGLAIMLGVLSGGEIGGGSMNPAASIGLKFGDSRLWIFVTAPLIGGAIAALLQQLLFTSDPSADHVKRYLMDANYGEHEECPSGDKIVAKQIETSA